MDSQVNIPAPLIVVTLHGRRGHAKLQGLLDMAQGREPRCSRAGSREKRRVEAISART